jgi:hypothetical protein
MDFAALLPALDLIIVIAYQLPTLADICCFRRVCKSVKQKMDKQCEFIKVNEFRIIWIKYFGKIRKVSLERGHYRISEMKKHNITQDHYTIYDLMPIYLIDERVIADGLSIYVTYQKEIRRIEIVDGGAVREEIMFGKKNPKHHIIYANTDSKHHETKYTIENRGRYYQIFKYATNEGSSEISVEEYYENVARNHKSVTLRRFAEMMVVQWKDFIERLGLKQKHKKRKFNS